MLADHICNRIFLGRLAWLCLLLHVRRQPSRCLCLEISNRVPVCLSPHATFGTEVHPIFSTVAAFAGAKRGSMGNCDTSALHQRGYPSYQSKWMPACPIAALRSCALLRTENVLSLVSFSCGELKVWGRVVSIYLQAHPADIRVQSFVLANYGVLIYQSLGMTGHVPLLLNACWTTFTM
jgi:hypothetical protein